MTWNDSTEELFFKFFTGIILLIAGDSLSTKQLESLSAKPRYDGANENVFNSPDANAKSEVSFHVLLFLRLAFQHILF